MESAPTVDDTIKSIERADGHVYKAATLCNNWLHTHKSEISARLNVGVGNIIEQISGKIQLD